MELTRFLPRSDFQPSCVCSRSWVLVVHNDFLQVEGYERRGDDVDVRNLRRVFQSERHCKFAELANCSKAKIIETISSEDKLLQLFQQEIGCRFQQKHVNQWLNLCAGDVGPPELFYIFILSHGESGGKILTDHLDPSLRNDASIVVLPLETYTTSDVWDSLADLHYFRTSTKLLFFAVSEIFNPPVYTISINSMSAALQRFMS
jgi:hypothetical protein